ncbi:MAG: hypothetical protein ACR2OR_08905 [Hyphomicrobiales bacterium]
MSFSPSFYRYDDGDLERIAEVLKEEGVDAAKVGELVQGADMSSFLETAREVLRREHDVEGVI